MSITVMPESCKNCEVHLSKRVQSVLMYYVITQIKQSRDKKYRDTVSRDEIMKELYRHFDVNESQRILDNALDCGSIFSPRKNEFNTI
jgi:hypothetical protein